MSILSFSRLLNGRRFDGALADQPDDRDALISSASLDSVIPKSGTVDLGGAPKNQGRSGSCCGQGSVEGVQLAYQALGIECPELSALFTYYNARKYDQQRVTDDGTSVRNAIKAVRRFGVCPESEWPMQLARVNKQPGWNAYRLGHDYGGIRGYYRIAEGDADSVRKALANKLPVVAWWRIDSAFKALTGPTVIGPCDPAHYVGNHCMLITTYYDNAEFGILNSWGGRWRHNGRQRVTSRFVQQGRDLWAIDVRR